MVTCHIHGHIHGHMWSYDLQTHDLDITSELERSLAKEKSFNDCQLAEVDEEILKLNTEARLLKSTISDLQKSLDKALLDAQKKQSLAEMRNEVRGPMH